MKHKKGVGRLGCFLLLLLLLSGCGGRFEGYSHIREYTEPGGPGPALLSVSGYDGLLAGLEELMRHSVSEADILLNGITEGEFPQRLEEAAQALSTQSAFGAFAGATARFDVVSAGEAPLIRFALAYQRPQSERNRLVPVKDEKALWAAVSACVFAFERSLSIELLFDADESLLRQIDAQIQNLPDGAYGMEAYTAARFPDEGGRILTIQFKYAANNVTLLSMAEQTRKAARHEVSLWGEKFFPGRGTLFSDLADHEKFYALYFGLLSVADYSATALPMGASSLTATAWGPLIEGEGSALGFAQAFQMLCDEAGLPSYVIAGRKSGRVHYWNLVLLHGTWYHTDLAEGDRQENRFTGEYFLFNDKAAENRYTFDFRSAEMECTGHYYTYERVVRLVTEAP